MMWTKIIVYKIQQCSKQRKEGIVMAVHVIDEANRCLNCKKVQFTRDYTG